MNKIIKSFFAFLLFSFASLVFSPLVFGVDLTVTCYDDARKCETVPDAEAALFYEDKFLPGDSVTRSIKVINRRSEDCSLIMDITRAEESVADFSKRLFTALKERLQSNAFFGHLTSSGEADGNKSLADLFFEHSLSFGTITNGMSKDYDWTVSFDPSTGNNYNQPGTETVFDFNLAFECGKPEVSPTPSPTVTPSSSPGASSSPGVSPSPPSFPTPSPGIVYYPYPGGGGYWAEGAVGGEATEAAGVKENLPGTPASQVKGEKSCNWWYYLWWLPLLAQLLLTFLYFYWLNAGKVKIASWWLMPIILAALSQIIHEILGCECVQSHLCPWYWLFNLLIFSFLTFYYWKHQRKPFHPSDPGSYSSLGSNGVKFD